MEKSYCLFWLYGLLSVGVTVGINVNFIIQNPIYNKVEYY